MHAGCLIFIWEVFYLSGFRQESATVSYDLVYGTKVGTIHTVHTFIFI